MSRDLITPAKTPIPVSTAIPVKTRYNILDASMEER